MTKYMIVYGCHCARTQVTYSCFELKDICIFLFFKIPAMISKFIPPPTEQSTADPGWGRASLDQCGQRCTCSHKRTSSLLLSSPLTPTATFSSDTVALTPELFQCPLEPLLHGEQHPSPLAWGQRTILFFPVSTEILSLGWHHSSLSTPPRLPGLCPSFSSGRPLLVFHHLNPPLSPSATQLPTTTPRPLNGLWWHTIFVSIVQSATNSGT